jgi:hypothetical protein
MVVTLAPNMTSEVRTRPPGIRNHKGPRRAPQRFDLRESTSSPAGRLSQTEKELPQPQVDLTFGLLNLNPAP